MPRHRLARSLLLAAALTGVMYLMVSLYLPSARRLIFGVHKRSGEVRVVRNNVTFLPPHQFYRLEFEKRGESAQRDGLIRVLSKEQVPVTITYRLRFSVEGERLPDVPTLVGQGWSAWILKRVSEVVAAFAQQVPVEELLSPTSDFRARREPLRRAVAAHLARSGLRVTAFEIARIEADREELLKFKRAELRRSARGVAGRVAIFAIDGADWDLLTELSIDGRIPNLKALIGGGASGSLQTVQPTVSPLVWTTIATGLPPDRHGILDFLDRTRHVPVDAWSRREPALWDIAEAFGRHAMVVNWWTAWPPTSRETFVFDLPVEHVPDAIHPANVAARVRNLGISPDTVGSEQVRRFLNITVAEYDEAVSAGNPRDPINVFRRVLAKTWTDHRVAINMYAQQQPLLFMMSFDGTDVANHLFGPFHPPYRDDVSQENYRRYWPAVANYYSEIDRLLGEWMNVLPADATVIIVSGHGFRWGKERPRTQPGGRSALSDHRNPGVFIAYGNHVLPSRAARAISAYDIVPTALAILGLPQSMEMPGAVATWPFRDIQPMQSVRVVSYSEFMDARPLPTQTALSRAQYEAALQTIGHLVDPSPPAALADAEAQVAEARALRPQQWGTYAYYNNLGIELKKQGKNKEAIDAFHRAIEINYSRPTPFLNLALLLLERQQYTAAEEVFLSAVSRGLPNADQWFAHLAAYYGERDMTSRAIGLLYKGKEKFPQSYVIAANLGGALAASSRYTEALPELERALELRPSSTVALNNLGMFYSKKNDYGRALDFWNRSLAIDPRQAPIRQAAEAARSRL